MRPLGLPVGLPVTSVGLLVLRVRDGDGGGGGGDGGIRRRDSPFNCIIAGRRVDWRARGRVGQLRESGWTEGGEGRKSRPNSTALEND